MCGGGREKAIFFFSWKKKKHRGMSNLSNEGRGRAALRGEAAATAASQRRVLF